MDTNDLRTLLLIRDLGGFAPAARALNLNPASISRRVADVEAQLGLRLFQRSTRRFSMTEAGDALLTRVAPLLDELDGVLGSAERPGQSVTGTLRLTTSVSFGNEVVLPILAEFHTAFPTLSIDLVLSDANLDLIGERIDLALRLAPAPAGDLISSRLLTTRYHVVASPEFVARHGQPRQPQDLSALQTVRFPLPGYRDRWLFRDGGAETAEVPVSGWLLISNALAQRRAAMDGLGVALLANWLVTEQLAKGSLVDLFPHHEVTATTFDSGVWALYPSRAYLPQRVRVLIEFLRTHMTRADSR